MFLTIALPGLPPHPLCGSVGQDFGLGQSCLIWKEGASRAIKPASPLMLATALPVTLRNRYRTGSLPTGGQDPSNALLRGSATSATPSVVLQVTYNMGSRFFLALFLVLLVLGCEVQGSEPDDDLSSSALLDKVQESLITYWVSAKAAAQGLYQNTYLTSVDEKLRDMYSKSSAAMSTYAGIFTDQLLTLLKGE